jgi:hypothetical protein
MSFLLLETDIDQHMILNLNTSSKYIIEFSTNFHKIGDVLIKNTFL